MGDFRTMTAFTTVKIEVLAPIPIASERIAITVNPGLIWGVENYGSLESGAIADIVIWDGDPLEVMSAPTKVMINGQWINLTTRQDLLRDRYSDLDKQDVPFGYR